MVRPPDQQPAQNAVAPGTDRVTALRQRYGLSAVPAGPGEDRVWLIADLPESQQPTLAEAKNMYATLSEKQLNQLYDKMDVLYGKGRWEPLWARNVWEEAATISAQELRAGKKVPVISAFDNLINAYVASGRAVDGTSTGGGGPEITKAINLTDPGTAETLLDQALQNYLGRKASNKEVTEFRKALRKAEMGSPTETDIEGETMIRSGGFNPATFADSYAQGMEGAGEFQAATTFLDAFIDALGPRVEV
jgi:hypothetical protein